MQVPVVLVKCLRQYCQHYKAPNLDVTASWQQGDDKETRTFNLLREDLETFDGWSNAAKRYLDTIVVKVEVLSVAAQYRNKVISFYEWFKSRQQEIHASELQRFGEKENKLMLLTLEDKIDMSFAQSQQGIPHRKDEIFTSIFASNEFNELENIPRDSLQRPLRAIQLLEQRHLSIPEETKQKIISLYQLPDILPQTDKQASRQIWMWKE